MVNCKECDKKLGILEGYRHPALGTKFLVCGFCFDKVNGDMERLNKFCLSDSFYKESSKISIEDAWNKKYPATHRYKHGFTNFGVHWN
jgi:hypothetical protein